MKKQRRMIVYLICILAGSLYAKNEDCLTINIKGEKAILHFEKPTKQIKKRALWIEQKNGKKELVWSNERSIDSYLCPFRDFSNFKPKERVPTQWEKLRPIKKSISDDPYINATLLHATMKDHVLLVLFRLDAKRNGFAAFPEVFIPYSSASDPYLDEWNGYDYFLRSFVRKPDGTWAIHLSVFLNTFWGDIVNDEITGLKILDKNSYQIIYKGSREIPGSHSVTHSFSYKVVYPKGFTVKQLHYSEKDKFLYSVEKKNPKTYIEGSVWWNGFDEFSWEEIKYSGGGNYWHDGTVKKLKIKPKYYYFFRKATEEDHKKVNYAPTLKRLIEENEKKHKKEPTSKSGS